MTDELEKLEHLCRATHDSVVRIESRLKSGDERMGRIEKQQEKHDHALFGNGKPGLIEVVNDLRKTWTFWRKLGWLAIGAAAPIIGGGVAAAIIYLIKHAA